MKNFDKKRTGKSLKAICPIFLSLVVLIRSGGGSWWKKVRDGGKWCEMVVNSGKW